MSFLWSAINSFCFRETPPRDIGVVSPSPAARGWMGEPEPQSPCSELQPGSSQEAKSMQIPNRKPDVPYYPTCPHVISLQAMVPRHLGKQRKATISLPAGSILFPDPAGPSHICGWKINTSLCVCCVPMQALGSAALQVMNYPVSPLALPYLSNNPIKQLGTFLANTSAGDWQAVQEMPSHYHCKEITIFRCS